MLNSIIIGDKVPNNEPIIFETDEYDKHVFPYEEEVPEGLYYAMIKKVENSQNTYHDPCFDVCLKLIPIHQPKAWENEQIDELTYYYIRQRYKKGSIPARKFCDNMYAMGLPKKFTSHDLEGHIAIINIEYIKNSKLGRIESWKSTKLTADWFIDDEGQEVSENTES